MERHAAGVRGSEARGSLDMALVSWTFVPSRGVRFPWIFLAMIVTHSLTPSRYLFFYSLLAMNVTSLSSSTGGVKDSAHVLRYLAAFGVDLQEADRDLKRIYLVSQRRKGIRRNDVD